MCRHHQVVFDRLLAAFGALQKQVASMTRDREVQKGRIVELEGRFLPTSPVRPLPG